MTHKEIPCDIDITKPYKYIFSLWYTVMAKNIGTLGKYDQGRLWKVIALLILLIFYLK